MLKVSVDNPELTGKELEKKVDEDIDGFNRFFEGLGNDPLMPSERAIIKTYLHHKLHPKT